MKVNGMVWLEKQYIALISSDIQVKMAQKVCYGGSKRSRPPNSHFKDLFVFHVLGLEIWQSYDSALIQSKADLRNG